LLEIPAKCHSNVEDRSEGFELCSRSHDFIIVNTVALSIAFGNIVNFVSYDGASVVIFLFADQLAF
jgi:hypothetical protein